jgi:hypothetical protein
MKKILTAVAFLTLSTSAFAAGYGDAGCGLGSVVFGSKQGMVQVLAATTNGTFGSQTFGISTGTSNCSGAGKEAAAFIDVNKESLANDIARGQGETVNSLASIYGCQNSEDMGATLKPYFKLIFEGAVDAQEINDKIMTIIKTSKKLSCNLV